MNDRIHYFSFYLAPGQEERRAAVPAGFAKVEYVAGAAADAGLAVRIVSTAITEEGRAAGARYGRHVYLPSWRPRGGAGYAVALAVLWIQIVRYLLVEVSRGDTVLAYHSLTYLRPFSAARRIKRFRLVLEFNDLYSAVSPKHAARKDAEERFIRSADAHLFMNRLAAARYSDGKPHVLSFGSYAVPKRRHAQIDDGRVHVVYAGVIEPGRAAAELAVRSAAHLDSGFVVHVLGYGTDTNVAALEALVAEINEQAGREAVIFHGMKRGQEFTDFLHGYHIGVSSHAYRPDDAASADYTFPSKIPQYAAHDLRVVSPSIPCVVDSPFAEVATFYDEHKPEAIAQAIRAAAAGLGDGPRTPAALVAELDAAFRRDLPGVLTGESRDR